MRALAQHRFGKVEAMAHGGLHCTAMRLVKGMGDLKPLDTSLTQSAWFTPSTVDVCIEPSREFFSRYARIFLNCLAQIPEIRWY